MFRNSLLFTFHMYGKRIITMDLKSFDVKVEGRLINQTIIVEHSIQKEKLSD